MNAEKVLKSINQIAELYSPAIATTPEFTELARSLREEIAAAELKKSGKANRYKAAVRFSKWVQKEQKTTRPKMAGAYIDESGAQWIFHPHIAVKYETPYDGLAEALEDGNRPDGDKIVGTYDSTLPVNLPGIGELKAKLKTDKADGNLDNHGWSLTELDGNFYNTELLIRLVEAVEPTEAYFSGRGKFPLLVTMGQGASGVLCPVRVTNGKKEAA